MFERSEFAALPMVAPQRREPRRGDAVAVAFLCLLSLGETKESERLPGRPRLCCPKKTQHQQHRNLGELVDRYREKSHRPARTHHAMRSEPFKNPLLRRRWCGVSIGRRGPHV